MDIRLPKMDGFKAAKEIRKLLPGCKMIALSMFDFEIKKANKFIDGYMRKSEFEQHLMPELKRYIDGHPANFSGQSRRLHTEEKFQKKGGHYAITQGKK
jgi:YesN/AraC family two-component response regulator